MTVTHTLSRRFRLLRDAATFAAVAILASCEFLTDPTSLAVEGLRVTPASATLPTNSTHAFVAYARLRNGESVPVTVTWSATGGSISSHGVYTAGLTTGEYTITATVSGFTATATLTLTGIPVASISVSPPSATLAPGTTQQLSAVMKDSVGNTLSGRIVTWSSSDLTVATVNGSGMVTAIAAGSATITATSEGKSGTSAITIEASAPASHAGYYVAPTGSPVGDGSATRPWNLATGLAHPTVVQPGDTIWLRGGTYSVGEIAFSLLGTAAKPIIVRSYPGEWAVIDGNIFGTGGHVWFWGFEILNSNLASVGAIGIDTPSSPGMKYINLIVHDHSSNGIGTFAAQQDTEVYGCLIYNNGRYGQTVGSAHGIYFANQTGSTKRLIDNIVFNNYAYNFHGYTTNATVNNLHLEGNVSFNADAYMTGLGGGEYLILAEVNPVQNLRFTSNYSYRTGGAAIVSLGRIAGPANNTFFFTNNYLGGRVSILEWAGGTFTGNTLANSSSTFPNAMLEFRTPSAFTAFTWNTNTYRWPAAGASPFNANGSGSDFAGWKTATGYDAASTFSHPPTGQHIVVRPNTYEAKRGHVIVYNWSGAATASVDLSGVLNPGDNFEIREVQNYFATPVLSGTYGGGSVSLSMAAVTAPPPLGASDFPALSTGTQFHAFVVVGK